MNSLLRELPITFLGTSCRWSRDRQRPTGTPASGHWRSLLRPPVIVDHFFKSILENPYKIQNGPHLAPSNTKPDGGVTKLTQNPVCYTT
ncbi:unnamed protein product, partial [Callosobruchus maculatus]